MRVALAVWDGRISPVFDVATRLRLLDVEDGLLLRSREVPLVASDPASRAGELARLGVDRLVCGAISVPFDAALAMHDIDVVSFVSGNAEDAARACVTGRLRRERFSMPGCGVGAGRRFAIRRRHRGGRRC